eukprot:m51a1_g9156 hypothetical protein (860) ;mRNA; f:126137-129544
MSTQSAAQPPRTPPPPLDALRLQLPKPEPIKSPRGQTVPARSPRLNTSSAAVRSAPPTPEAVQEAAGVPDLPPDSILLGEFSEQHGPTCLWRIPDVEPDKVTEARLLSSAMSVDYQSRQGALSNFAEDTKVSSCDPVSGATQYLHHFTLLDVHARGYVRPMMLAYVTYDPALIMANFEEMSSLFTEVAKMLKRANRLIMRHDIEHRIADLKYTAEVFAAGDVAQHFPEPPKYSESAIPEHMADLQQFKKKLESFPEPACLVGDIDPEEARALLEEPAYAAKVIQYIHKGHFDRSLRDMEGLCGESAAIRARGLLERVLRHFQRVEPARALEVMSSPDGDPRAMSLVLGQSLVLNFNTEVEKTAFVQPLDGFCIGPAAAFGSGGYGVSPPAVSSVPAPLSIMRRPIDTSPRLLFEQLSAPQPCAVPQPKPFESLLLMDPSEPLAERDRGAKARAPGDAKGDSEFTAAQQRASLFFSGEAARHTEPRAPLRKRPPDTVRARVRDSSTVEDLEPEDRPGYRLREVVAKYSFAKHLVYSLLKGRPVIVRGNAGNQQLVRDTVVALSVFVAGASKPGRAAVEQWHEAPIRMADLAYLRLFGYCRASPLPKAVEKCTTVLNVDEGTLVGPVYPLHGQFIEEIIAPRCNWPDDETFIAHVHEALVAVAVKAFLYFHMCCVGVNAFTPLPADIAQQPQPTDKEEKRRSKTRSGSSSSSLSGVALAGSFQGIRESPSLSALDKAKESPAVSSLSATAVAARRTGIRESPALSPYTPTMQATPVEPAEIDQWALYSLVPVRQSIRENARNRFWKELDVRPGDRDILEYLADIVKEQQVSEMRAATHVPRVTLDYTPTQLFRNVVAAGRQ